ncbi:hypothetical protein ACLOJK_037670 [Asimina triloba]
MPHEGNHRDLDRTIQAAHLDGHRPCSLRPSSPLVADDAHPPVTSISFARSDSVRCHVFAPARERRCHLAQTVAACQLLAIQHVGNVGNSVSCPQQTTAIADIIGFEDAVTATVHRLLQ